MHNNKNENYTKIVKIYKILTKNEKVLNFSRKNWKLWCIIIKMKITQKSLKSIKF